MTRVDENMFGLFIRWYDQNVSSIRSEIVTVADRINYFNSDDDMIGYISVYIEDTYHIRETYFNMFATS